GHDRGDLDQRGRIADLHGPGQPADGCARPGRTEDGAGRNDLVGSRGNQPADIDHGRGCGRKRIFELALGVDQAGGVNRLRAPGGALEEHAEEGGSERRTRQGRGGEGFDLAGDKGDEVADLSNDAGPYLTLDLGDAAGPVALRISHGFTPYTIS